MAWSKRTSPTTAAALRRPATATPRAAQRSAGTFSTQREPPQRAAHREEQAVLRGRLARRTPGRGHLPRVRRDRLAALQAHRAHHPRRLRLQPEQALLPVLRPPADAPRSPRRWSRTGSPRPPPAGCRPARSASTTPCCTRSSNARSATSSSSPTPARTPSCPRSSRRRPAP